MCWCHGRCLVGSCCCGVDLSYGVFFWAVVDAFVHLALVTLPNQAAEMAPFAQYFMAWVGLIVFIDVVLAFGAKAGFCQNNPD